MKIILSLLILIASLKSWSQKRNYLGTNIAFYNLENLFDYENDPLKYDEDFTPEGIKKWDSEKYFSKIEKLSETIYDVGKKITKSPPSIIGVAEVENRKVLEELISYGPLAYEDYGIVHYESPDLRGIDVGLLYHRELFKPTNSIAHKLHLTDEDGKKIHTRDQLCVSGYLGEELFYFVVNHWPSRRGGQEKSAPKRMKAAKLTSKIIDSIHSVTPNAKLVVMGDFNDNPTDESFKKILKTSPEIKKNPTEKYLYNPMEKLYERGVGSHAHQDEWSLFDQIIVSDNLLQRDAFQVYRAAICYNKDLITKKGKYKGYPFRTYGGTKFQGGYSDHLPVYITLLKKVRYN